MMLDEERAGDSERSAALDGWVAAFVEAVTSADPPQIAQRLEADEA